MFYSSLCAPIFNFHPKHFRLSLLQIRFLASTWWCFGNKIQCLFVASNNTPVHVKRKPHCFICEPNHDQINKRITMVEEQKESEMRRYWKTGVATLAHRWAKKCTRIRRSDLPPGVLFSLGLLRCVLWKCSLKRITDYLFILGLVCSTISIPFYPVWLSLCAKTDRTNKSVRIAKHECQQCRVYSIKCLHSKVYFLFLWKNEISSHVS